MLLPQLHADVSGAVARLRTMNADSTAVVACVEEIAQALTKSDVRPEIVSSLRENLKEITNIDTRDSLRSKLLKVEQVLYKELCQLFYAEVPVFTPEKGKCCAILFLGQQDLEKEAASVQYAYHHKLRGFNASIVCATKLKYEAYKKFSKRSRRADVPFFESYSFKNREVAARLGLSGYRKSKADIIIVVARDDMLQVAVDTQPNLVVLIVDASIGAQAVFEEANIFKAKHPSGAVILTRMIPHTNAAGAISSVAAAKVPLLFVGTADGFDKFDAEGLVTQLLGLKNKMMEINTHDFHNLLLDCDASEAEEIAVMENLKNAFMEQHAQQLAHYKLLRDEILNLGAEYSDLCDQLGEPTAKTTKIKAGSLEDRHACMLNSVQFLRDTKLGRTQHLDALQRRAQAICQFLGEPIREQEYQFLSSDSPIQVQQVVNVNGLSQKFIGMVQEKVAHMEDLMSTKQAKIFGKMDELDKLLKQEPQLKHHPEYKLEFTRHSVETGTVVCQVALRRVEDLIEKAVEVMLMRKVLSYKAKELIEADEVVSEARLDDIRAKLKMVINWQLNCGSDLSYVDDVKGVMVMVEAQLRRLEENLLLKLRAVVVHTGVDYGDEMALSPERVGEHQNMEAPSPEAPSPVVSDVNMSSNGTSPEGSRSDGTSPEGSRSDGTSPEGGPSDGTSSEQISSETDDLVKDPNYSPRESDDDMRD